MENEIDYSVYQCPYAHLKKDCGHELHGPGRYRDIYSVWCQCGFRGPVFYFDPEELGLVLKENKRMKKYKYYAFFNADEAKELVGKEVEFSNNGKYWRKDTLLEIITCRNNLAGYSGDLYVFIAEVSGSEYMFIRVEVNED